MLGPPNDQAYEIRAGKGASASYKSECKRNTLGPELSWRLEPYGIGHGPGLILAAAQEEGVEPFFSHPYFFDRVSTHNYTYYLKEDSCNTLEFSFTGNGNDSDSKTNFKIEPHMSVAVRLLRSNGSVKIGDVAFYLEQKDRIQSLSALIAASEAINRRSTDCGVIVSKFVGTTVIDAAVFAGMPVSSSLVAAYEVGARWLRGKG